MHAMILTGPPHRAPAASGTFTNHPDAEDISHKQLYFISISLQHQQMGTYVHVALIGFAHYTAAKGAILSFTRTLALELGSSGVTANCVAPGATRTPMLEDVPEDVLEAIRAGIPLGRLAEVDDIVPSYVFLASEDARHYQGQCISPNGGDVFL